MTLVKTNGTTVFPEFPTLFDDLFAKDWLSRPLMTNNSRTSLPAVNVIETHDNFLLEVAAPGMSKKDFHVELDNNLLVISAQREEEEEKNDQKNYTRREFNYQSFSRTFTLPDNLVDGNNISARYDDGILKITVPKLEEAKVKPAKKIKIA